MSEIPSPEIHHNLEEELNPEEMAQEIKNRGMGYIKCRSTEPFLDAKDYLGYPVFGENAVKGFYNGVDIISGGPDVTKAVSEPRCRTTMHYSAERYGASSLRKDYAFLATDLFRVPMMTERFKVPKKTLFGIKEQAVDMKVPVTLPGGFQGKEDWRSYSYEVSSSNPQNGRGEGAHFIFNIPPEIASKLDKSIENDPYFIDNTIKALYPGIIGTNKDKNLVRRPSRRLFIAEGNPQDPSFTMKEIPLPHDFQD
jgi:hypothetical protein